MTMKRVGKTAKGAAQMLRGDATRELSVTA